MEPSDCRSKQTKHRGPACTRSQVDGDEPEDGHVVGWNHQHPRGGLCGFGAGAPPADAAACWWTDSIEAAEAVVDMALRCDLRTAPRAGELVAVTVTVASAAIEAGGRPPACRARARPGPRHGQPRASDREVRGFPEGRLPVRRERPGRAGVAALSLASTPCRVILTRCCSAPPLLDSAGLLA
jgi:hypothetical protein